jgi:hypothetical protein
MLPANLMGAAPLLEAPLLDPPLLLDAPLLDPPLLLLLLDAPLLLDEPLPLLLAAPLLLPPLEAPLDELPWPPPLLDDAPLLLPRVPTSSPSGPQAPTSSIEPSKRDCQAQRRDLRFIVTPVGSGRGEPRRAAVIVP